MRTSETPYSFLKSFAGSRIYSGTKTRYSPSSMFLQERNSRSFAPLTRHFLPLPKELPMTQESDSLSLYLQYYGPLHLYLFHVPGHPGFLLECHSVSLGSIFARSRHRACITWELGVESLPWLAQWEKKKSKG